MHDLEKATDEEGPLTPPPGLLTPQNASTESKSTSSPFQAIAWMAVNTLATVGIASHPPKRRHLVTLLTASSTGLHQQGHLFRAPMEALSAHLCRHAFPHDLAHAFRAVPITNWHLRASPSSRPAHHAPGYGNVLQRYSP